MNTPYDSTDYFAAAYFPGPYWGGAGAGPARPPYLFEDQLATWLAGLLGTNPYPNQLPSRESDYPLLSYTIVDGAPIMRLSGASGLDWIAIQFDAWAPAYADAANLIERLRLILQDYRGPVGLATLKNCIAGRPRSFYEANVDGTDEGAHRYSRDFKIWYLVTP